MQVVFTKADVEEVTQDPHPLVVEGAAAGVTAGAPVGATGIRSRSPRRDSRDERRSVSPHDSRSPRRSPRDSRSPMRSPRDSRSPRRSPSPSKRGNRSPRRSPSPSKRGNRSPTPNVSRSPAPREHNDPGSMSPKRADSRSPADQERRDISPAANRRSPSPGDYKANGNHGDSPRGSASP
ncbi:hypothetical protein EJB05_31408 [Eragrostis curvula]|uniref:Uncharacterized protein n=1 Tax=Eragrostis curvula TaxID=38414 RepID=A0A5J9UES4_9POAL|nr:hypothetical protein EJB05_31408 [Eragrostis curvula]